MLRQDGLRARWGREGPALRDGARRGPAQPPSPAAARASYQVTKLPQDSGASDWRGCSQSESGAAVLGQEAWRHAHLPTPRKPLTQARWRAPPLSRGHAEFFSTVTHTRRPSHRHTCARTFIHTRAPISAVAHLNTCTHNTDTNIHTYTRI